MIDTQRLEANETLAVLLVGSAATARAAQPLLKAYIVLDYEPHDDLSLIAKRNVDLWPDALPKSKELFARAAEQLLMLQCPRVRSVSSNGQVHGWNIGEAIAEGWTGSKITAFAREHIQVVHLPTPTAPESIEPKPKKQRVLAVSEAIQAWGLKSGDNGRPYPHQRNIATVLQHSGRDIWFDTFTHKIKCYDESGEEVLWSEIQDIRLAMWLQDNVGMHSVQPHIVRHAVREWADTHRKNEAQEWLHAVQLGSPWDGENRLEHLMSTGFGAPRSLYTAAVGRCFMVSLVARILDPGCKVDTMPVLEGGQGIGKSQALEILGGRWYHLADAKHIDKDFYIGLLGKSVVEIAEMTVTRKNDVENVKSMITSRFDNYREPYGRDALDHRRTCVFVGTTNSEDWNADETGARRFLPIACTRINLDWIRENRLPLYAEAIERYARFHAGDLTEGWWTFPVADAEAEQLARRPDDPWDQDIRNMVRGRDYIFTSELMEFLLIDRKDRDLPTHRRLGSILRRIGFKNTTKRDPAVPGAEPSRCYVRVNSCQDS